MTSTERSCPNCRTPLPAYAAFCYACGTATPVGIDRDTNEYVALESTGVTMEQLLPRLRSLLGPAYELGERIGSGGFAEVFLARDLRLKREVAIKVTRPDFAVNAQMMLRFRREAETIAALRHPHIMPIYDIGEAEGIAYLVMPFIRGESLRARLDREGRLPVEHARQILLQAADALATAHEAGVVHRDMKPDNIMLDRREDQVLLMDFGIAKAMEAGADVAALTSTGLIMGTPHYMSPEQAAGERTVDARSDQYSLAVIAYRMLAGALPFDGPTIRAILAKQLVGAATPLHEVAPDAPPVLVSAIERAMAKEPDDRFLSVRAFINAVRADPTYAVEVLRTTTGGGSPYTPMTSFPAITPPATTPVGAPGAAPPAARPTRWGRVAAAVVGLAVVAGAGYAATRRNGPVNPETAIPTPPPATTPAPADSAEPGTPTGVVAAATDDGSAATARPSTAADSAAKKRTDDSTLAARARLVYGTPAADSFLVWIAKARPRACERRFEAGSYAEAANLCGAVARVPGRTDRPAAQRTLGALAERANKLDSAIVWYRLAAPRDAAAALRLADMYDKGRGTTADPAQATQLIETAAKNGSVPAKFALAERYARGVPGLARNEDSARGWYVQAATAGDVTSMRLLGDMFRTGRGAKKSDADAANWYTLAAQKGDQGAQYELGMAFLRGRGVVKSDSAGLDWLRKAAAQGHDGAQKELKRRGK